MRSLVISMLLSILAALLLATSFASCSSQPEIPSSKDSTDSLQPFHIGEIDSAVIYCWCFKNGESSCMTYAAIKPAELCDTNKRLLSIAGFQHISGLRTFLSKAKVQKNNWGARDARFVIKCYGKDTSFLLTYADYNDSTLWIDKERELKCNQPVLQWIMNEMGLEEIDCPD